MTDLENMLFLKLRPAADHRLADLVAPLLAEGETVLQPYQGLRDGVVFTDRRVIAVNTQGFTGKKKTFVSLDELETAIPRLLEELAANLYQRALENREARTWAATTMDQVKQLAAENNGYIKTMWCGDEACEEKMKEEVGLSSRCMPFEQEHLSDVCPCCGKPAKVMVYWGKAY